MNVQAFHAAKLRAHWGLSRDQSLHDEFEKEVAEWLQKFSIKTAELYFQQMNNVCYAGLEDLFYTKFSEMIINIESKYQTRLRQQKETTREQAFEKQLEDMKGN